MLSSFLLILQLFGLHATSAMDGSAVDFSDGVDNKWPFYCLYNSGVNTAILRVYSSDNDGSFDNNSVTSYWAAQEAPVFLRFYMNPFPNSNKSAKEQIEEVYDGLRNGGIATDKFLIYIQIHEPEKWKNSAKDNIIFIRDLIINAQKLGLNIGIYSNADYWEEITGNWTGLSSTIPLWYQNLNNESEYLQNFDDFKSFGKWTVPNVKQYAQSRRLCGINVNMNVYVNAHKT